MTQIELEFELGMCNGTMHIEIYCNDQLLSSCYGSDTATWKTNFTVTWPATVTIKLSNKDMRRDTQIDQQGNIVADKYVKLSHMSVNGFALTEQARYKICNYQVAGHEPVNDIFWGFPGQVHIDFNQTNPLRWQLALNNVLFFRET
jgi:hypothetical protein